MSAATAFDEGAPGGLRPPRWLPFHVWPRTLRRLCCLLLASALGSGLALLPLLPLLPLDIAGIDGVAGISDTSAGGDVARSAHDASAAASGDTSQTEARLLAAIAAADVRLMLLPSLRERADRLDRLDRLLPAPPTAAVDTIGPGHTAEGVAAQHSPVPLAVWLEKLAGASGLRLLQFGPPDAVDGIPADPGPSAPDISMPVSGSVTATSLTMQHVRLSLEGEYGGMTDCLQRLALSVPAISVTQARLYAQGSKRRMDIDLYAPTQARFRVQDEPGAATPVATSGKTAGSAGVARSGMSNSAQGAKQGQAARHDPFVRRGLPPASPPVVLAGIWRSGARRAALLRSGARTALVAEGDVFAEARLTSVTAGAVVVTPLTGDTPQTLWLRGAGQ